MSEKPSTAPSFDQWWEKDGMRIRALISDHGKGLARDAWNAALAARPSTDAVDEYERVNLREACAAIMTSGPFSALNTGDWVGQIRWRLEKFNDALRPNATAEEMIARAKDRLAARTVAPRYAWDGMMPPVIEELAEGIAETANLIHSTSTHPPYPMFRAELFVSTIREHLREQLAARTVAPSGEFAWLIENVRVEHTYWDGRSVESPFYTADPNDAIRFARKVDAEMIVHWLLKKEPVVSREHGWVPNAK